MTSFNVGDKVHVEFDAIVETGPESKPGRLFTHTLRAVTGGVHYVLLGTNNATVTEPSVPESWPPCVGDIWEADGNEYFVYAGLLGDTVFPTAGNSGNLESYSVSSFTGHGLDEFKALRPKLVRRAYVARGVDCR